jgi:hypothetical protein
VEPHVLDDPVLDPKIHPDHVAAKRVVLFVADVRVLETAEVPRVLVVVEDVLPVKLIISSSAGSSVQGRECTLGVPAKSKVSWGE